MKTPTLYRGRLNTKKLNENVFAGALGWGNGAFRSALNMVKGVGCEG